MKSTALITFLIIFTIDYILTNPVPVANPGPWLGHKVEKECKRFGGDEFTTDQLCRNVSNYIVGKLKTECETGVKLVCGLVLGGIAEFCKEWVIKLICPEVDTSIEVLKSNISSEIQNSNFSTEINKSNISIEIQNSNASTEILQSNTSTEIIHTSHAHRPWLVHKMESVCIDEISPYIAKKEKVCEKVKKAVSAHCNKIIKDLCHHSHDLENLGNGSSIVQNETAIQENSSEISEIFEEGLIPYLLGKCSLFLKYVRKLICD